MANSFAPTTQTVGIRPIPRATTFAIDKGEWARPPALPTWPAKLLPRDTKPSSSTWIL